MGPHAVTELILAAAACTAVARWIYLNLAKEFPALLAYLAFLAVINLGYGLLDQGSASYFWTYVILEPLKCVFSIFAVREIFALTFVNYPGIRTVGRWAIYLGVSLALSISLLLTGFFWRGAARGRAHSGLFYFLVSQRSVVFTLALVIVVILLFLSRYPLQLSRNTLVSCAFFGILFLSEAAQLLIDSLAPGLYNHYVDWTESVFMAVCLVTWVATLQREEARDCR
jgi:hypothetical protein